MKFWRNYCFIVIIVSLLLVAFLIRSPKGEKYKNKLLVADKQVWVDIARTSREREEGLSGREKMCSDCGMLFVFDQKGIYPFWMRRMYFDIDILWILSDQVVDITYGAKKPSKEDFERPREVFQSKLPVDKVLEVNAGWVAKNGIKAGDVVKY